MTTIAVGRLTAGGLQGTGRPARAASDARSVVGPWGRAVTDPRLLTGEILAGLVLVIAMRHPLTNALGTGADTQPAVLANVPVTATKAYVPELPQAASYPAAVPLHLPRDPFAPLESAAQSGSTASAGTVGASGSGTPTAPTAPSPAAHYTVHPGDSLWSIAVRQLGGTPSVVAVSREWHRIYRANQAVIGGVPSHLTVGTVLRLP